LAAVTRRRLVRGSLTLLVTGLCVAYLAWKIDLGTTLDVLGDADLGYFLAAAAIMLVSTIPMAWRWQRLLAAKDVEEPLGWLTRTYLISYTAGQVLPTSIGGDAVRAFETARRHPGQAGLITGSVLLDRALGGAATLVLAAAGFALAIGEYDVGAYLWVEGALILGTVAAGVVVFSQRARRPLARLRPLLAFVRLERPLRAVYEGMHTYRTHARLLAALLVFTLVVQAFRVLPIWLVGKSVAIDLSPRPYYVMGPILFVVLLAPFTINGLAVREAFFVSFLGNLGVAAEPAFAAGFLFFLVTLLMAAPGAVILGWEALRRA
jgi:glycosyltransferase 2 family protein